MAIVNKRHSATEYALLSSVFALSRSVAGCAEPFATRRQGALFRQGGRAQPGCNWSGPRRL